MTDLGAGGVREMSIKFTARENQREIGFGFYVMPYHSSAQYVHFVKDYGGIGGFGRVYVFKITPADGQSLPSPPN